jgi:2-keto-4-pentenoate hydratase/2-oxohepta-3-ene-1,7-dioic acid hydratase in catechol pathway
MANWVQFERQGETAIGTLEGDTAIHHEGELLNGPVPPGKTFNLDDVKLLAPFQPRSIIALWNNFHERAKKEGHEIPKAPLVFMKPVGSVIGPCIRDFILWHCAHSYKTSDFQSALYIYFQLHYSRGHH